MSAPDLTPVYVGKCPECQHTLAVTVADPANRAQLGRALKDCRDFERQGLVVSVSTVAAFQADPNWRHAVTCQRGQQIAARRAAKKHREAGA